MWEQPQFLCRGGRDVVKPRTQGADLEMCPEDGERLSFGSEGSDSPGWEKLGFSRYTDSSLCPL